mmetsp:Transcript_288/g.724  ORF Transcript_288/g.724 Transcript_288/m.724 type:complete len:96 (-) Transcript_288:1322-1609(-)
MMDSLPDLMMLFIGGGEFTTNDGGREEQHFRRIPATVTRHVWLATKQQMRRTPSSHNQESSTIISNKRGKQSTWINSFKQVTNPMEAASSLLARA